MHLFRNLISALATIGCIATFAQAQQTPSQRVASEFARSATARLSYDPLTVDALQMGIGLITEATALDPDNIEYWQTALNIAQMAEDEQLKAKAIERLTTLDPGHEVARLTRLNAALDRYQVFEERKA